MVQAAADLELHDSQRYEWRQKATLGRSQSDVEQSQSTEIARPKRLLAEQAQEVAILKSGPPGQFSMRSNIPDQPVKLGRTSESSYQPTGYATRVFLNARSSLFLSMVNSAREITRRILHVRTN